MPAAASPMENLRWLEDHLDVTYSPACCSYNAGTTTLIMHLPKMAGESGDVPYYSSSGSEQALDNLQGDGTDQNLVDIFGRVLSSETRLQPKRQAEYKNGPESGPLVRECPQGHESSIGSSGPGGSLSQIEESEAFSSEERVISVKRSDSTFSDLR